jgi:hypothetical protein
MAARSTSQRAPRAKAPLNETQQWKKEKSRAGRLADRAWEKVQLHEGTMRQMRPEGLRVSAALEAAQKALAQARSPNGRRGKARSENNPQVAEALAHVSEAKTAYAAFKKAYRTEEQHARRLRANAERLTAIATSSLPHGEDIINFNGFLTTRAFAYRDSLHVFNGDDHRAQRFVAAWPALSPAEMERDYMAGEAMNRYPVHTQNEMLDAESAWRLDKHPYGTPRLKG